MSGVFISKGMSVSIPAGGMTLQVGPDGKVASNLVLHVRFNVCPSWVEIARQHVEQAAAARLQRIAAWAGSDEIRKAAALEQEFHSAMQGMMASAIALDAFYSAIRQHVVLPQETADQWRKGRTSRQVQVTEVLRRAFGLRPKGTAQLKSNIKEIFRFRDLAVHPSGKLEAPILHPELQVGVEWRFAYFTSANADAIFRTASRILWDLSHNGKSTDPQISDYTTSLAARMQEIFPGGFPESAL